MWIGVCVCVAHACAFVCVFLSCIYACSTILRKRERERLRARERERETESARASESESERDSETLCLEVKGGKESYDRNLKSFVSPDPM